MCSADISKGNEKEKDPMLIAEAIQQDQIAVQPIKRQIEDLREWWDQLRPTI